MPELNKLKHAEHNQEPCERCGESYPVPANENHLTETCDYNLRRTKDVELAEKVLGWKRVQVNSSATDYGYERPDVPEKNGKPQVFSPTAVPHLTIDIALAMELVETMGERGYKFACERTGPRKYSATFTKGSKRWSESDLPLPEAISKAALATSKTI